MKLIAKQQIDLFVLGMLVAGLVGALLLAGCAQNREQERQANRTMKRVTTEVRQEITPAGQIVRLVTKTTTIEREDTGEVLSERTETETPEILGTVVGLAKGVATAAAGPAGGMAVDFIWQLAAGLGITGAAGGAGKLALDSRRHRRERGDLERQRKELVDGIERAKETMPPDVWDRAKVAMAGAQSDDTQRAVWELTP
jgi:hypothetical protein